MLRLLRDDFSDSTENERNDQAKDILEHLMKEISHITKQKRSAHRSLQRQGGEKALTDGSFPMKGLPLTLDETLC